MIPGGSDDEPELPDVGDVFWVDMELIQPPDEKADTGGRRPAIVVAVPPSLNGRIRIVTRTRNLNRRPGIHSPAERRMGLLTPGVWGYLRSVEAWLWTPPSVERAGSVHTSLLAAIREEFGL